MLIGIDASRANRSHKSGTEWYSYYLIRWLAKLDKENEYILYSDKPLTGGLLDLTTAEHIPGTQPDEIRYDRKGYQILKSPGGNFRAKVLRWPLVYFWTQGRMSLEMILHRPDVLFVPAHTIPILHPRRSIVTIHDIGYERDLHLYEETEIGPGVRRKKLINLFVRLFSFGKYGANAVDYLRWSTNFAIRKADRIIAISNYTKHDIISYFRADEKKISVIYDGYNAGLYKKIDDRSQVDQVLSKYGITRPFVFYIGRIERKKNIPTLIEAYAMLREHNSAIRHKLVLVGDASYGYDETKYMIREFDLSGEVLMPGWVEEADIPYIYNGAAAFIFPSQYEGFGIPLLQAMACEVPIATSNKTSIPEVVGDAALLFNPTYALSIAEALGRILTDDELRRDLVARGRERVRNFSWQKTARETLELISYK